MYPYNTTTLTREASPLNRQLEIPQDGYFTGETPADSLHSYCCLLLLSVVSDMVQMHFYICLIHAYAKIKKNEEREIVGEKVRESEIGHQVVITRQRQQRPQPNKVTRFFFFICWFRRGLFVLPRSSRWVHICKVIFWFSQPSPPARIRFIIADYFFYTKKSSTLMCLFVYFVACLFCCLFMWLSAR